jgi:rhamnulokinase
LSFAYRDVLEELERITGRALGTVRVVGGGSLNHFLCQMTADACGRAVIAGPVEASALGSAMMQALATGHLKNLAEGQEALRRSVEVQSYEPAQSAATELAFERYQSLVACGRSLESVRDEFPIETSVDREVHTTAGQEASATVSCAASL